MGSMKADEPTQEGDLEYLGYYSPAHGANLFEAFGAAGIGYAADFIDSTGAISPVLSLAGGTFGNAVRVLISIDPARRKDVDRIHKDLFGDCLPNYDSSFFKEQQNLDPNDRTSSNET
jgi:hypothetical protein